MDQGSKKNKKNKNKRKKKIQKTCNLDIVSVWGVTEVRSKPTDVNALANDSLLEPHGAI